MRERVGSIKVHNVWHLHYESFKSTVFRLAGSAAVGLATDYLTATLLPDVPLRVTDTIPPLNALAAALGGAIGLRSYFSTFGPITGSWATKYTSRELNIPLEELKPNTKFKT